MEGRRGRGRAPNLSWVTAGGWGEVNSSSASSQPTWSSWHIQLQNINRMVLAVVGSARTIIIQPLLNNTTSLKTSGFGGHLYYLEFSIGTEQTEWVDYYKQNPLLLSIIHNRN